MPVLQQKIILLDALLHHLYSSAFLVDVFLFFKLSLNFLSQLAQLLLILQHKQLFFDLEEFMGRLSADAAFHRLDAG